MGANRIIDLLCGVNSASSDAINKYYCDQNSLLTNSYYMKEISDYQEILYRFQPYIKFWISARHPYGLNK